MQFDIQSSAHYDAKVTLKNQSVACFSAKYIKNTYPQGGCKVLGEIDGGKAKKALGSAQIGQEVYDVSPPGSKNPLLWRTAGYLQVGDDQYIAVMKSRVPVLVTLGALIAMIILLGLLRGCGPANDPVVTPPVQENPPIVTTTPSPSNTPDEPVVTPPQPTDPVIIQPDQPLPPVDENAEAIEGDNAEKPEVDEGGGSVALMYSLDASLTLSDGNITIFFKNPGKSTHNVTLDMYILSGGQEYLIAQSGLLEPGFGLSTLQLMPAAPSLSEGIYDGLFRVHVYDPSNGEQALVVPEIPGLNITVTN